MKLLRSLLPIKPTDKGLKSVQSLNFQRLCQEMAHKMLCAGKTWDDIDAALQYETIRELMPNRHYDADDFAEFYKRNWQLVTRSWFYAVEQIKKDHARMMENPERFLKELGILPSSPLFGQQVASTVNRPLPEKQ